MDDIIETYKIKGYLAISPHKKIPLAISIYFNKLDACEINIELTFLSTESDEHLTLDYINKNRTKSILFTTDYEGEIILSGLNYLSHQFNVIKIKAHEVIYGHKLESINKNDKLEVTVNLTPANLYNNDAMFSFSYDGSITRHAVIENNPIYKGINGKYKIYSSFEYIKETRFNRKTTLRVESTQISHTFETQDKIEFDEIKKNIDEDLDNICTALRFASRSKVQFYEINYAIISTDKVKEMKRRVELGENFVKPYDSLMHSENISGDRFDSLCKKLSKYELDDAIKNTIVYLSSSYSSDTIESSYFKVFIALDTIVNFVLHTNKLEAQITKSSWKAIESSIREHITETIGSTSPDIEKEIKQKLPELRRHSLFKKVNTVVDLLNVNTNYIWTTDPFTNGFNQANKLRNELFHSGNINDLDDLVRNRCRLQYLVEEIILKLIAWNKSELSSNRNKLLETANWPKLLPYGID